MKRNEKIKEKKNEEGREGNEDGKVKKEGEERGVEFRRTGRGSWFEGGKIKKNKKGDWGWWVDGCG